MKKIRILLAALLVTVGAAAQNPSSYFMEGSTFRSQLNPAFAPQRGYVNFPVLGGIQVGMSGNISLDKIFYPRDGKLVTLLDSSVSRRFRASRTKTCWGRTPASTSSDSAPTRKTARISGRSTSTYGPTPKPTSPTRSSTSSRTGRRGASATSA